MHSGKRLRLKRIIRPDSGTSVICALDHGMTSPTALGGLHDTRARLREAIAGGADTFMLGTGMAAQVVDDFTPSTALAVMLTASAAGRPAGSVITPINSVEWAVRLGADAVVVYVALAGDEEPAMISYASRVAEAADRVGLPLIAEAEFPNAYQSLTEANQSSYGFEYLRRNARLCAELGADIVKVNWSGDERSFGAIVDYTPAPVVVAGGTLVSDVELLTRMESARRVGAVGCSVGRNVFEHQDPEAVTRAISRVIHEGWTARQALEELNEHLARVNTRS